MLKTIAGDLLEKSSARLLEPDDDVRCDAELYAAVERNGKAVVINMGFFQTIGEPYELTPEQFRAIWQGD